MRHTRRRLGELYRTLVEALRANPFGTPALAAYATPAGGFPDFTPYEVGVLWKFIRHTGLRLYTTTAGSRFWPTPGDYLGEEAATEAQAWWDIVVRAAEDAAPD